MNQRKKTVSAFYGTLYFFGLLLLLGLGTWQVLRGLEKSELRESMPGQDESMALSAIAQLNADAAFHQVSATGSWIDSPLFVLDNRIYQGAAGYEVLSLFRLASDNGLILVNRGWVKRNEVGKIPERVSSQETVTVAGVMYQPQTGFTLGPSFTDSTTSPVVLQYIDAVALEKLLGEPLSGFVLVQDPDIEPGLVRLWKPYVMDPERHYGYAFQWWGLALVFLVFGVIWYRMAARDS